MLRAMCCISESCEPLLFLASKLLRCTLLLIEGGHSIASSMKPVLKKDLTEFLWSQAQLEEEELRALLEPPALLAQQVWILNYTYADGNSLLTWG